MNIYATSEEKAIPLSEVELHKNYAVIITTNAGLWRYKIGDTIRFTSLSPYRIKVSGRTKHHINVFGEELIIENAEEALKNVCAKTEAEIVDYTAAPIFMVGKEKGAHQWLIEFKTPPTDIDYFNELFDNALKALNSDYEAKRYNSITLNKPKITIARKNLFHDWLKQNNKLGGQHKVPRLSNTRDYINELLELNVSYA
ncbi:putative auxin-regulated protein [Algibacter lectus]|uniref:Putative auxin-regulated protein n=2 Tax=Algibacter lectus TaxID=221126 RepID=A0A090VF87_9FLAO|nr:putative auxin-regulated protein [Algibacter lectus]